MLFFFQQLASSQGCPSERTCMKHLTTALRRVSILMQPGLKPVALGLRDCGTDRRATTVLRKHVP